jgi:hypothetical protein
MDALDEKIKAYSEDPNGSLDLPVLGFGIEGAKKVASLVRNW